jgi:hypothetical protein
VERSSAERGGAFLRGITQPIPNPGFGQQILRPRGIFLNLFPECFHERAQVVKLGARFLPPHGAQQFGMGYRNALIPHEQACDLREKRGGVKKKSRHRTATTEAKADETKLPIRNCSTMAIR